MVLILKGNFFFLNSCGHYCFNQLLMLTPLDQFYLAQDEPERSCFLALKALILSQSEHLSATWKYGMPFFYFHNQMFCYFWFHKRYKKPYIGVVNGMKLDHPELLQEKRARMKILLIDPAEDLPVAMITDILQQSMALYNIR